MGKRHRLTNAVYTQTEACRETIGIFGDLKFVVERDLENDAHI